MGAIMKWRAFTTISTFQAILTFFLTWVVPVFPTTALATSASLYECDFELGNCLQYINGNIIDTFLNLGVPALPGGGIFALTQKTHAGLDPAEGAQWYYNQNATQALYMRMYFYIPAGFTADFNPPNSLKFIGWQHHDNSQGFPDQSELHLYQSGPNLLLSYTNGLANWNIPSGNITISSNIWHYIEVYFSVPNNTVQVWFDTDSRTQSPKWQLIQSGLSNPSVTINYVYTNLNWSGGLGPKDEQFYIDGLQTATTPIGDTYGLLGAQPPPDTTPPAPPTGLIVQ
jgi:hypothetical protein